MWVSERSWIEIFVEFNRYEIKISIGSERLKLDMCIERDLKLRL